MTTSIDDTGTLVLPDDPIALDALAAAVAATPARFTRADYTGCTDQELAQSTLALERERRLIDATDALPAGRLSPTTISPASCTCSSGASRPVSARNSDHPPQRTTTAVRMSEVSRTLNSRKEVEHLGDMGTEHITSSLNQ